MISQEEIQDLAEEYQQELLSQSLAKELDTLLKESEEGTV